MKIGIFDPNLDSKGHFLAFNKHIIKLLYGKKNEVVFFDVANIFKSNCPQEDVKFINVADVTMAELSGELKTLFRRLIFLIKEFFWFKDVIKKIQETKPDFLIITSPGYFSFYFFRLNVRFAIIFHFGWLLFSGREFSVRYFMQILRKKVILRFLRGAAVVFTLSDYLNGKMSGFNFKRAEWLPYICFENFDVLSKQNKNPKKFTISTPGVIYQGKNIDFILDAYKKYNLNFKYIVAGFPIGDYGNKIVKTIESLAKTVPVSGIFKYLSSKEYNELIRISSFVLLPYSSERSNGISAVMQDAFENNTPIIAPDIEPFRYYVNKYKLGLLYKPDDQASFAQIIEIASRMDKKSFASSFSVFKKDFSYAENSERFKKIIYEVAT